MFNTKMDLHRIVTFIYKLTIDYQIFLTRDSDLFYMIHISLRFTIYLESSDGITIL